MQQSELDFINTLRQSTRYIEQHRGKTCVIYIPGEFMAQKHSVAQLSQDIGLLHNLGLKMVLVMGANQQLDEAFANDNFAEIYHQQFRITTTEMIPCFQKTIGLLRSQFEACFSQANSHQPNPPTLVSGNWVVAQPKGVIQGVDFQHTGKLRKIQHKAISDCLASGQVALLTPIAYSLTGEVFNLNTLEQACEIAAAIEADKLMIYAPEQLISNLPKQMSLAQLREIEADSIEQQQLIEQISVVQKKVKRIHLIDENNPSALLLELFTRDGVGTMIFSDRYHQLRQAQIDDVCGILALIEPLEQAGILVKRSRERLELEINNFYVIQRDDLIIGCAALYPSSQQMAELACLAVSKDYQGQELGFELLQYLQKQAKQQGCEKLFLLTTHTHHWFIEHGFALGEISMLPDEKQSMYNYQRQSKVLIKPL